VNPECVAMSRSSVAGDGDSVALLRYALQVHWRIQQRGPGGPLRRGHVHRLHRPLIVGRREEDFEELVLGRGRRSRCAIKADRHLTVRKAPAAEQERRAPALVVGSMIAI
jgi:hypothetical protein